MCRPSFRLRRLSNHDPFMMSYRKITVIAVFVGMLSLLCSPQWILAQSKLKSSSPKPNEVLSQPPTSVTLIFEMPIYTSGNSIMVTDQSGRRVDKRDTQVDSHDKAMLLVTLQPLQPGTYTVRYVAVGATDGYAYQDSFEFGVGIPVIPTDDPAHACAMLPPLSPTIVAAAQESHITASIRSPANNSVLNSLYSYTLVDAQNFDPYKNDIEHYLVWLDGQLVKPDSHGYRQAIFSDGEHYLCISLVNDSGKEIGVRTGVRFISQYMTPNPSLMPTPFPLNEGYGPAIFLIYPIIVLQQWCPAMLLFLVVAILLGWLYKRKNSG